MTAKDSDGDIVAVSTPLPGTDVSLAAGGRTNDVAEPTSGEPTPPDGPEVVVGTTTLEVPPVLERPIVPPEERCPRAGAFAQSKKKLMTNTLACSNNCEGCQAKSGNRPHFKHSFERDRHETRGTISRGQLTVADEVGTYGIGGYRCGLVIDKVGFDFWQFVPLRSLFAPEVCIVFKSSCKLTGSTPDNAAVYCDAHSSLQKICKEVGQPYFQPPPCRPHANAVS